MLSLTAEYALRAVVFLAAHPGTVARADAISQATGVPLGYLTKIMQGLARTGLTSSYRGPHGGFILVRTPADITLLDVVRAVDGAGRTPGQSPASDRLPRLDQLARRLCAARDQLDQNYQATTIAQLIATETSAPSTTVDQTQDATHHD
jgi:Rrf2 family transcriptional regulator, nitric oxide-sensitive transcriptional repressor